MSTTEPMALPKQLQRSCYTLPSEGRLATRRERRRLRKRSRYPDTINACTSAIPNELIVFKESLLRLPDIEVLSFTGSAFAW